MNQLAFRVNMSYMSYIFRFIGLDLNLYNLCKKGRIIKVHIKRPEHVSFVLFMRTVHVLVQVGVARVPGCNNIDIYTSLIVFSTYMYASACACLQVY